MMSSDHVRKSIPSHSFWILSTHVQSLLQEQKVILKSGLIYKIQDVFLIFFFHENIFLVILTRII